MGVMSILFGGRTSKLQRLEQQRDKLTASFEAMREPREFGQSGVDDWAEMTRQYRQLEAEIARAKMDVGFELGNAP